MVLSFVFIQVILAFIAWQDFRFRAVYWWLFPLLLTGLFFHRRMEVPTLQLIEHAIYNIVFLGLQLLLLTLYFSLRTRSFVNVFKGYLGLGDLLFLLAITVYFSFLNFVAFYAISLLAVVLLSLLATRFFRASDPKIPLAGYQALMLMGCVLISQLSSIDIGRDTWLDRFLIF